MSLSIPLNLETEFLFEVLFCYFICCALTLMSHFLDVEKYSLMHP